MRKYYSIPVVLGILFLCLFISAASADLSSEATYKTDTKTLSYFDGSKNATAGILVSKYDSKDNDRANSFLQVSYINTAGYKAIRISDLYNSKGAIAYIPVANCEKILGMPPYGLNDARYYPEKVTIEKISYYQFKIPHFSDANIDDWLDANFSDKLPITIDSTALSADVTNSVVVFYFSDNNVSGAITDSDNNGDDFKFYALNANSGSYGTTPTLCDYDPFNWTLGTGGHIAVEIPFLDKANDLTMYMYYNYSGDFDNPAGTYSNSLLINNYESTTSVVGTNATAGAGASSTSSGYMGKGYSVGTTNGYVRHGDEESASAITVLTWCKIADTSTNYTGIIDKYEGATSGYGIWIPTASNGYPVFNIFTSNNDKSDGESTRVDDNNWHLIVGVYDSSNIYCYVDGVSSGGTSETHSIIAHTGNVYVSTDGVSTVYGSDKVYDNIMIFSDAKTASWISAYYKSTTNSASSFYTFGSPSSYHPPYFEPTISYPTNSSTVTDSLNVTVTWDDNASYTFQAQVSFDDPTFADINIFYNVSDIETGEYEFALYDVTYYATRVRAFHIVDEEYGPWSDVVEFYLNYTPSNIPDFNSPVNLEEVSTMKVTFTYTEVEGAVSYDIAIYDNPDYTDAWLVTGLSPTGSYVTYLANGTWYVDIRAKFSGEDNYSDWASVDARSIQFDKTNIPVLVTPADSSLEEGTINTVFEWTNIEEVTGYRLQAIESTLEPANWTTPDEEWSGSYNYSDEIELSNGVWWWRVQAYDAISNGSWTDPFFFEIDIAEIPFIYTVNSANYYDTDEVLYEFFDITSEYDIDIYNVTSTGARGAKLDTLTATPDESNESSIQWTFAADSDFIFETVVHDTGGVLFRHAVKPYDEKMAIWTEGYHRARIIDGIRGAQAISVCIGDMFYSGKDQILHDPYDYPSALYTRGEDIALHYSIPIPTDAEFEIVIKDMETGYTVATILSEDLYAWNYELGYADRNFILISTDGTVPVGADPYLASTFVFEGDDWNTLDLPKGAYDYIIRELGEGNRSSIGESVLLIGNNTSSEWTVAVSKSTLQEGAQQIWTIALPTEDIWGAYSQMMFIDYSSGVAEYKLTGDFDGFAEYPPIWQSSFTITYNTEWDGATAPVGRLYVRPNNLNFQDYEDAETWYSFVVSKSFTMTAADDTAGDVNTWLDTFGLNSELYKLIFAMAGIIAGIVIIAVMGLPTIVIGLVGLMLYIVFLALGWIPLWTAILLAMAFVAVLYKMFFGGNGGEA